MNNLSKALVLFLLVLCLSACGLYKEISTPIESQKATELSTPSPTPTELGATKYPLINKFIETYNSNSDTPLPEPDNNIRGSGVAFKIESITLRVFEINSSKSNGKSLSIDIIETAKTDKDFLSYVRKIMTTLNSNISEKSISSIIEKSKKSSFYDDIGIDGFTHASLTIQKYDDGTSERTLKLEYENGAN